MYIISSTRILQTPMPTFFLSKHLLLTGYHTRKKDIQKQKRQREDRSYNEANETKSVTASYGFIKFTKHFRYIGSFVPYNLHDDYDVDRRLSSTSQLMGSLNHFWRDTSVNLCSKYLIFLAISINLLLQVCESWDLRISLLDKLEVSYTGASGRYLASQ